MSKLSILSLYFNVAKLAMRIEWLRMLISLEKSIVIKLPKLLEVRHFGNSVR